MNLVKKQRGLIVAIFLTVPCDVVFRRSLPWMKAVFIFVVVMPVEKTAQEWRDEAKTCSKVQQTWLFFFNQGSILPYSFW